jgi:hypothetical protein
VLADGTRVTADEFNHADLFWALRGGGGNFGIVTSMRLKLHSHGKIAGGAVIYPWDQVEDTLIRLGSVVASAPDELTVDVAIVTGPAGGPILLLLPCWIGEFAKSESVFSELQQLGTPIMAHLGPTTCAEMVSGNNEYVTHGQWNELLRLPRVTASVCPSVSALQCAPAPAQRSPCRQSSHRIVILRGCDFFDSFVFWHTRPDLLEPPTKAVILSEAPRRPIA